MDFKKLRASLKKTDIPVEQQILDSMNKGCIAWNKEREHPLTGSFHVSSLGKCLRKIYYSNRIEAEFPPNVLKKFWDGVDSGLQITTALQKADSLVGCLYCKKCNTSMIGRAKHCYSCGAFLTYSELAIKDFSVGEKGLSGKVDAFYQSAERGRNIYVVEAKTATTYYKPQERSSIDKFMPEHIHQGNAYLGMIRKHLRYRDNNKESPIAFINSDLEEAIDVLPFIDSINLDYFILLYKDKNTSENYAHRITYNPDMFKDDLDRVKYFFSLKGLPEKEVTKKNCRYCDFIDLCSADKDVE